MTTRFYGYADSDGDRFAFIHDEDNPGDGYELQLNGETIYSSREQLGRLQHAIAAELQIPDSGDDESVPILDGAQQARVEGLNVSRAALLSGGIFTKGRVTSPAVLLSTAHYVMTGEREYVTGEGEYVDLDHRASEPRPE